MKQQLTKEERELRNRLKKAQKSGNPNNIINIVNLAMSRFDEEGYPEDWEIWEKARATAQIAAIESYGSSANFERDNAQYT